MAQSPLLALIAPLHRGKKVMFPIPKHDQAMVGYFKELIESGQFKPVIDRRYPLAEAPKAIRYLLEGHARGKVVITI